MLFYEKTHMDGYDDIIDGAEWVTENYNRFRDEKTEDETGKPCCILEVPPIATIYNYTMSDCVGTYLMRILLR